MFHRWGDKDFDWDSLYKAIDQGTLIMSKLGRINVYSKEKFGGARWDLSLSENSIISIYQALVVKLTFLYLWHKFPHIRPEVFSDAPKELLFKKHSKFAASFWQTSCKSCDTMVNCAEDFCPKCGTKMDN